MMEYTYTGRNLFVAPEYYHYAQCNEAGYLETWRASRRAFITSLVATRAAASNLTATKGEILQARLFHLLSSVRTDGGFSSTSKEVVNRLIHKYEVSRRLYQNYSAEWRRLEGVPEANLTTYLLFAELLVLHCRHLPRDRQKLSTLIKLCDALSSLNPSSYTIMESRILESVLFDEERLVDQLVLGRS